MIHSTALVHPTASINESVEIGAYSIVEKNVTIGAGTVIKEHAVIRENTTLGDDNIVYQFATIGEAPQDLKFSFKRMFIIKIVSGFCSIVSYLVFFICGQVLN